jgi:hypothetical protein
MAEYVRLKQRRVDDLGKVKELFGIQGGQRSIRECKQVVQRRLGQGVNPMGLVLRCDTYGGEGHCDTRTMIGQIIP